SANLLRSRQGHEEVHSSVRRHRQRTLPAQAGEQPFPCLTAFPLFLISLGAPSLGSKHRIINANYIVGSKAVLERFERAINARKDLRTVYELDSPAFDQGLGLKDLMLVEGHHGHLDEQRDRSLAQQLH